MTDNPYHNDDDDGDKTDTSHLIDETNKARALMAGAIEEDEAMREPETFIERLHKDREDA